jgi:NADPH:quinone reductase-like Zn-dependent oxidoreductase
MKKLTLERVVPIISARTSWLIFGITVSGLPYFPKLARSRSARASADTVGGEVAAKLITKVKQSGSFGYTSVLRESAAAKNPTVKIARVRTLPDPSKVREFADDVRDGKFVLPIGRRMPLRDAAEAHALGEKGGIGKILLLAPDSNE